MATTFAYKVRDRGGKVVEGQLEADDASLVAGKLRQMGYTPISIQARSKARFTADVFQTFAHRGQLKRPLRLGIQTLDHRARSASS